MRLLVVIHDIHIFMIRQHMMLPHLLSQELVFVFNSSFKVNSLSFQ